MAEPKTKLYGTYATTCKQVIYVQPIDYTWRHNKCIYQALLQKWHAIFVIMLLVLSSRFFISRSHKDHSPSNRMHAWQACSCPRVAHLAQYDARTEAGWKHNTMLAFYRAYLSIFSFSWRKNIHAHEKS